MGEVVWLYAVSLVSFMAGWTLFALLHTCDKKKGEPK